MTASMGATGRAVTREPTQAGLPGRDLDADAARAVKQRIRAYKYPRFVQFIDKLPKTAAGKLLPYKLRASTES